jgi:hypothetical protein
LVFEKIKNPAVNLLMSILNGYLVTFYNLDTAGGGGIFLAMRGWYPNQLNFSTRFFPAPKARSSGKPIQSEVLRLMENKSWQ